MLAAFGHHSAPSAPADLAVEIADERGHRVDHLVAAEPDLIAGLLGDRFADERLIGARVRARRQQQ
ncbi:MAG: hypothetical protein ABEN55_20690, partial [Bradymonadaceae bacterium]